jgi:hypothetical protein
MGHDDDFEAALRVHRELNALGTRRTRGQAAPAPKPALPSSSSSSSSSSGTESSDSDDDSEATDKRAIAKDTSTPAAAKSADRKASKLHHKQGVPVGSIANAALACGSFSLGNSPHDRNHVSGLVLLLPNCYASGRDAL